MMLMKTPLPAIVLGLLLALPPLVQAQSLSAISEREVESARLLEELAQPDLETSEATEQRLLELWSRSGSATADLLLDRGRKAIEAEDLETAIDHLTALTDHAPDFAEGWQTRASAFFAMGEYGLAFADLERALVLNPSHFGALTGLGVLLGEMGNPDLALKALKMAQDLNPHAAGVADAIERVEYELGRSRL